MFHSDVTFVLSLLALAAGAFLALFSQVNKENTKTAYMIIGYLMISLSGIMLFISGYNMPKDFVIKRQITSIFMQHGKMISAMQRIIQHDNKIATMQMHQPRQIYQQQNQMQPNHQNPLSMHHMANEMPTPKKMMQQNGRSAYGQNTNALPPMPEQMQENMS